jgi:hypothetical protein
MPALEAFLRRDKLESIKPTKKGASLDHALSVINLFLELRLKYKRASQGIKRLSINLVQLVLTG